MKFLAPEDYQDRNIALFEDLKQRLASKLPKARIEHVGASAVPGALSKGDLDVFVGVPPKELEESIEVIETLGFEVKRDTLRTSELCMFELRASEADIAIQLVANNSRYEFFVDFRDTLRGSAELLSSYNTLKESCSGLDPESYRDKKSQFIEAVLDAH